MKVTCGRPLDTIRTGTTHWRTNPMSRVLELPSALPPGRAEGLKVKFRHVANASLIMPADRDPSRNSRHQSRVPRMVASHMDVPEGDRHRVHRAKVGLSCVRLSQTSPCMSFEVKLHLRAYVSSGSC